jgi:hypothetical protein
VIRRSHEQGFLWAATPALLAGGNPQITKADGDAPVRAYIEAMPGWKRDIGRRLDALIVRNAPDARKAVKWNLPFCGIEGKNWFAGFHTFTNHVKVTFFQGTMLQTRSTRGQGQGRRLHQRPPGRSRRGAARGVGEAGGCLPGWATSDIRA